MGHPSIQGVTHGIIHIWCLMCRLNILTRETPLEGRTTGHCKLSFGKWDGCTDIVPVTEVDVILAGLDIDDLSSYPRLRRKSATAESKTQLSIANDIPGCSTSSTELTLATIQNPNSINDTGQLQERTHTPPIFSSYNTQDGDQYVAHSTTDQNHGINPDIDDCPQAGVSGRRQASENTDSLHSASRIHTPVIALLLETANDAEWYRSPSGVT
ncbi:hypothetical protein JX266_002058 [Neoarthrinium moseri]|nr:hypothetical protein JX266_002058 [Neoarthrinium moseri]